MIYWKGECKILELEQASIIVVDHYDERGIPVFVTREVSNAIGMKSGKNSYWGVEFEEELSDGSNAVAYTYVLAYSTDDKTEGKRLLEYHPAWILAADDEEILEKRKNDALASIDRLIDRY